MEEELEKRDNMIVLAKERVRDRDSVATNDISKNYIERVKMIVREAGVPFFLTTRVQSDPISQVDLVDRLQEKMKHNKMSVIERKQKRGDKRVVRMFTQERLMDSSMESKVTIMVTIMEAITTLLTNTPEMGNSQLEEALLERMLVMARID